ncbi:hypothetical protein NPIL_335161 [Nephila pilipes]|uniref:Uncharacterized protein n=1 Tax=Nephila pilipes TaxID=299642 RepID=A0A8X6TJP5_NEPPI|nr:hypothetical protein NPIL_335161 [Nephila pilipes]
MKFLIFAAVIVFVVVEVTAPPPPPPSRPPGPTRPPKGKRCSTAEDCDAGECCIDGGIFKLGFCRKLATKGERCNLEDEITNNKYSRHCPCSDGLTCEAEKIIKAKFEDIVAGGSSSNTSKGELRVNERCVSPTSTSAAPETKVPGAKE